MNIGDLIGELEQYREEHGGDVDVVVSDDGREMEPKPSYREDDFGGRVVL